MRFQNGNAKIYIGLVCFQCHIDMNLVVQKQDFPDY